MHNSTGATGLSVAAEPAVLAACQHHQQLPSGGIERLPKPVVPWHQVNSLPFLPVAAGAITNPLTDASISSLDSNVAGVLPLISGAKRDLVDEGTTGGLHVPPLYFCLWL